MTSPPPVEIAALNAGLRADAAAERRRVLLIVNPHASTVTARLQQLVPYALANVFELDSIRTTGRARDGTRALGGTRSARRDGQRTGAYT